MNVRKTLHTLLLCISLFTMTGCAVVVKRVGNSFSESLTAAVMNHNDLQTVRDGAPAYMLLMDSLLARNPEDPAVFASAAGLYSAYAGVFVIDETRALRLSDRAFGYAKKGLCLDAQALCDIENQNFEDFEAAIKTTTAADLNTLYTAASVWAGWVQIRKYDWGAIAHLAKIKGLMNRVVELDPRYKNGQAQMYMGVLESLVPPAAGGDLEKAKTHFETADAIAEGKNLFVKVLFAEKYARMLFDQDLHDALLKDVLAADVTAQDLTLMNIVAQETAAKLLEGSAEYFE